MFDWATTVAAELGIEDAVDHDALVDTVLDLTADVAHNVSRPGAPVTAFLVGIAVGRAENPKLAAREYAATIAKLSEGWRVDEAG